ncbi:DNA-directed RNA polymerase subunit beta [Candidatus Hydrogenosomobacter endosymbioticus]|uniref:DNA-directed RNA polymerase subunit beta n=1 Tax=Candidatus Hydrogenosomobacter endosymbioticus TaxID=2558174 RepID=A0ABN6L3R1_9PROT|nr:DNA-directed RNA polymerase subunit beta [Candidatus Hydrogenosomobacter endosymbioticus]BDB96550.1 DNA-directed RNA polymerase subunit beta [Candidatus Hydrogenosomobacter endosymbioticus]
MVYCVESFCRAANAHKRIRYNFAKITEVMSMPSLIDLQEKSYQDFLQKDVHPNQRENKGLQAALQAAFPINDFSGRAQLEFDGYKLCDPKYDIEESKYKGVTYASPMRARLRLVVWSGEKENRTIKHVREQEVYLGDVPLMTGRGTFIINGIERVVVSQMHRAPGVFFDYDNRGGAVAGRYMFVARVIPFQGSWLDFEFDMKDVLYVRIDRKRKFLASTLLMALSDTPSDKESAGMSKEELLSSFYDSFECSSSGGVWRIPFMPSMWKGVVLDGDMVNAETGEVVVKSGGRIDRKTINAIQASGVRHINIDNEKLVGKYLARRVVSQDTGEVFAECGAEITMEFLQALSKERIDTIQLLEIDHSNIGAHFRNTLMAEKNETREEALVDIYRILRPGETPTLEAANTLLYNSFFNPERYDLSDVGRIKINSCLNLDTDVSVHVLQKRDLIAAVKFLLRLKDGHGAVDDIDSLANRRVRPVGELLEGQYRAGIIRMKRGISERMVSVDLEQAMPNDLLNVRPLSAIIREFFGASQLSQFMDQTNPLSEVSHKRRLSSLGPGGLSRDRAGFEVRDVHPTHYGRTCPVETPESVNIGLISAMATYARVNKYGFLETPYRKVRNGKLTDEIIYLSAKEEEKYSIAQADVDVDEKGNLLGELVGCRRAAGDYALVPVKEVDFTDISPRQIVSVAAALIPFIECDDAARALMGSNMQRQAVPLLRPQSPLIGTGMEEIVARDSGAAVVAKRSGVVDQVSSERIVVRATDDLSKGKSVVDIYSLAKFQKSNAGTCVHQRPLVYVGQSVKEGDVIADGPATDRGDLALGRNVTIALMSLNGYCFEDSIVISSELVKEDAYTTLHIEELEVSAKDTRLGPEYVTRDIPGVSEESLRHLDESGIAYIGAEVRAGDVLVGRVSPKAEAPLTPEEKLLRAIFADKACEVKDTSLRVPPGVSGTVVDVRVFSRRDIEKDERSQSIDREAIARLVADKETERKILDQGFDRAFKGLVVGKIALKGGKKEQIAITEEYWESLTKAQKNSIIVEDAALMEQIKALLAQHESAMKDLQIRFEQKVEKIHMGDDLPAGVLKTVKVYIAVKRKIQVGDKMAGRHGNKGVVSIIVPVEDMPYLSDGTPVDVVLNPLSVPSRMNIGQILEMHLGWAALNFGKKAVGLLKQAAMDGISEEEGSSIIREGLKDIYCKPEICEKIDSMSGVELIEMADGISKGVPMACPAFEGAKSAEITDALVKAGCTSSGQEILHDGLTGEPFDRPVTVGVLYVMKLHHLVDEKIHARSVGPYSLVTQQPLGGKAQFGGQRFGEMEVWALEAYGAAYTLQEMLTVKSDDVEGRTKVYEAIIKGQEMCDFGIPESFYVLNKEIRTLGLNMECCKENAAS